MPKLIAPSKPKPNWRLWLRVAAWSGVFMGVAWGGIEVHSFLLRDPRFELACESANRDCANLEIHGTNFANRARVAAVFSPDFGRSIFDSPLAERRRHLLAIDWVRTAAVTRVWPNRIVVTITERTPVAFAKLPMANSARHWMALIDQDGVLLSLPSKVRFHLPVLSGITDTQSDEERMTRVHAMQHLLEDLGPQAKDISEINAANVQEMRVVADVDGQGVELLLGDQHYRARYQNFVSHYPDIRIHSEHASTFDLRLDDRILAR
ncbi:MAG: cell division protein FtsQ [Bryobacterales bacterium]|jgi:cell division protein FtsQ|nr:cell division protein FtsQ [Bryobacterales bacterium]